MSTGPRTVADTPAPEPAALDLTGRVFGDYRVLRKLGQGGMGQVYLAEQISLGRKVALKILRPEMASSAQALARFREEAKNVARATHANIVQVYAFDTIDGMPYMALEYVEGRNLKDFLVKKGPPDLLVALSIMRQVASALQRAAELGIIHRDIKPENILLTRKGEVKVADFGLSRCLEGEGPALNLTQTGVTMGTPLYMSPEQVEGKPVDARTDIYSFGVTCYQMLTGQPPFRGESAFEVALAHVTKQPVPLNTLRPDLPEALCAIVHKMMAKSPEDRYATGRELLRDIVKLREGLSGQTTQLGASGAPFVDVASLSLVTPVEELADSPTEAVEPIVTPPPRRRRARPRRKRGWIVAVVLLTLLAAISGGAAFAWRERRQAGPMGGANVRPADASTQEALQWPADLEQALRKEADLYLSAPGDKNRDLADGFVVMHRLGLLYLEQGRFAEAEKFFDRLAGLSAPKSYRLLGQLGQAIVLALRDEARASNTLFKQVFHPAGFPFRPRSEGKGKPFGMPMYKKAAEAQVEPIKPVLEKPRWQYWLTRARWFNRQNGVRPADEPAYLVSAYPLTERPAGLGPKRK